MVDTLFFPDAAEFQAWLEVHHHDTAEVWVRFHKRGSGLTSQSWSEAVDVALCFGWIDGLRASIDRDSYRVRFTPRKKTSVWSSVNVKKAEALIREGKMRPEGLALFASRTDAQGYSAGTRRAELTPVYERSFRANQAAWEQFSGFAPAYRRDAVWWVMSAKQETTRQRRLGILIESSADGLRVPVLRPKGSSGA